MALAGHLQILPGGAPEALRGLRKNLRRNHFPSKWRAMAGESREPAAEVYIEGGNRHPNRAPRSRDRGILNRKYFAPMFKSDYVPARLMPLI